MEKFSYWILSQRLSSTATGENNESTFFTDVHSSVRALIDLENGEKAKLKNEVILKAVSSLRGTLTPYLATPLKSDKDDIEKGIKDIIEHVIEKTGDTTAQAFSSIATFGIMDPSVVPLHRQIVGVIKRLLKNGRTILADGGVTNGKNYGPVYLTRFGTNFLSTIPSLFSAMHSIVQTGEEQTLSIINDSVASMSFSETKTQSAESHRIFLNVDLAPVQENKLIENMSVLKNQFGITDIQVSRKVLASGFIAPVQIFFSADLNIHPLGSIILSLVGNDDMLEDAITTHGSLLVLEKIA